MRLIGRTLCSLRYGMAILDKEWKNGDNRRKTMINTIGTILRRERNLRGITQERLCEGICTPGWLSKIENGTRMPDAVIAEALLKRLGLEPHQYIRYTSEEELEIHNLKYLIRKCHGFSEDAKEHFIRLKQLWKDKQLHTLDKQFLILGETIFEKEAQPQSALESFIEAIHLTRPSFDKEKICKYLLSDEEIIIINNIALNQNSLGNREEAVDLLSCLKEYMEKTKMDYESRRRTYPLVLFNLARWQREKGAYAACLENCERGIEFCKKYNLLFLFPNFLFHKGCALASLAVREEICSYFSVSYRLFRILDQPLRAEEGRKYVEETYGIRFSTEG